MVIGTVLSVWINYQFIDINNNILYYIQIHCIHNAYNMHIAHAFLSNTIVFTLQINDAMLYIYEFITNSRYSMN